MISETAPDDFQMRIAVVACYVRFLGRIVLLHRLLEKRDGGKWGLPAGKVNEGESIIEAMIRELFEEIGLRVSADQLKFRDTLYVRPDGAVPGSRDIIYHTFDLELDESHAVVLSPTEHDEFRWVTSEEALALPLIHDLDRCIQKHDEAA